MKNVLFALFFALFTQVQAQQLAPTDYEALVVFTVTDEKGVPEQGALIKLEDPTTKQLKTDTADINGKAELLVAKGTTHKLSVEKASAKFDFGNFDVPKQDGKFTMEENLQIKVVTKYNRIYELKIHFAPNKSELYDAAIVEVDKLYDELVKNPTMKIEVAGHTDNVGEDLLNMQVSQKRANAIKAYLLKKGISEKRVLAKGYGETAPIADNVTEDGRTKNRRIEVRMF